MNSRLSKIRSEHTYGVRYIHAFASFCRYDCVDFGASFLKEQRVALTYDRVLKHCIGKPSYFFLIGVIKLLKSNLLSTLKIQLLSTTIVAGYM